MDKDIVQQIEEIAAPHLSELEIVLVDLIVKEKNNILNIDLLADKATGGITLEECAELNRKISSQLEDEDIFSHAFIVSVCSPGLDRPLKTENDFRRVLGRDVRFYLSEKIEHKLEHVGCVKDIKNNEVIILNKNDLLSIPIDKINKAIQEI